MAAGVTPPDQDHRRHDGVAGSGDSGSVVGDSLAVAGWTLVSRFTGFLRAVAIAAVLGPTYLGNTFQAVNVLPNLTFYFLTGSLFTNLLVPPLVRRIQARDAGGAERLTGGFLGTTLVALTIVTMATVAAGPLVLGLLSAGVDSPAVAAAQLRTGWPLLAMLMPQVVLYAIAGTAGAAMNAHGRFALAAGAPALENIGMIVTLLVSALIFATGGDVERVTLGQLLLLGLGTTASVGLHAAVLWWGARHVGVRVAPSAGWRDPQLRGLLRRAVSSVGYTGLESLRLCGVLVVANSVPGGVVAFLLALNFVYLAAAIGARPVAVALLPQLSRLHHEGRAATFRDELLRGLSTTFLLTVPAVTAYIVLAAPLARAVAFGEMATGAATELVAVSLAAVAVAVLGESVIVFCTHACYARDDARLPLRGMMIRTATSLALLPVALSLPGGAAALAGLGLALVAGDVAAAWYLLRVVRAALPAGGPALTPPFLRALAASLLMAGPALLVTTHLPGLLPGPLSQLTAVAIAALVGMGVFVAVERAMGAPELSALTQALSGFRRRPRPAATR